MLEYADQPPHSTDLAHRIGAYLRDTLHLPATLTLWSGTDSLPAFLSKRFAFFQVTLCGRACLFASELSSRTATPAEATKIIELIEQSFDGIVIYAAERLPSDNRSRLIARGVPFVIPGNQMYIPQLALDLREYFRAAPAPVKEKLSSAAQSELFHRLLCLYHQPPDEELHSTYSAMTVWRSLKQLALFGLGTFHGRQGRTNHATWSFHDAPAQTIQRARELLCSPVRRLKHVSSVPDAPPALQSGESALAAYTTLSPPDLPVYAIHYKSWDSLVATPRLHEVKFIEDAASTIELWHYDPLRFYHGHDGLVDPLSLYAQFWNHPDERVAGATSLLLEPLRERRNSDTDSS